MSVADEIKHRIDIVDLVSESVSLKKAGRNFKGLCPFHQEKTPSFIVFPETQTWHCFGSCGEGGDIFSFVQKLHAVDFSEALRLLAERAGISLQPQTEEMVQQAQERDRQIAVLEEAAAFFERQFASPAGQIARDYVAKRKVGQSAIAAFRLGYAPNSWRALSTHLMTVGYTREELASAGLIIERDDGGFYDRFRNRLMFPIWDGRGRVVGFGARSLDGSEPKYLNSPQTQLFDKSAILYALDKARRAIADEKTVVIVEGYMDAIAAHEHGFRNVVASMGTAINENQLQSLRKIADHYVLALDADAAGNAATLRGVSVASEALRGEAEPTFDGGLLRFEERLQADIRVAILPEGKDPDEIIRENRADWEKLVAQSKPLLEYHFDLASAEVDLHDAKSKSRFVRQLLPVIASVADPIEKAHYIEKMARRINVAPELVEREMATVQRRGFGALEKEAPQRRRRVAPLNLEEYALRFLLRYADGLLAANQILAEAELDPLTAADFNDAANKSLFRALQEGSPSDRLAFRTSLSGSLRQHFDWVEQSWALVPETNEQEIWRDGISSVLRLREKRLKNDLKLLQRAMESMDREEEGHDFEASISKTTKQVLSLTRALAQRSLLRSRY